MIENIIIEVYGVSNLGIVSITVMTVSFFWFLVHISKNGLTFPKIDRDETDEDAEEEQQQQDEDDDTEEQAPDLPEKVKITLEEGICPICGDEIDKEKIDWEAGEWECENCDS